MKSIELYRMTGVSIVIFDLVRVSRRDSNKVATILFAYLTSCKSIMYSQLHTIYEPGFLSFRLFAVGGGKSEGKLYP